jgi:hypothetical protein
MFRGINPNTFLDDWHEWHALVLGFCETSCPWRPRRETMSEEDTKAVTDEYHYYAFGRVLGFVALIGLAVAIVTAFI